MHADANWIKVARSLHFLVDSPGGLDVDAELVFAHSGRYIRMGLGEDVRVHAQGYPGGDAPPAGPLGEQCHLRFTLGIENQNTGSQGKIDLFGCLAHTGEYDPLGCFLIYLKDAKKLSTRDDIESRSLIGKQLEDR